MPKFKLDPPPIYDEHYAATQEPEGVMPMDELSMAWRDREGAGHWLTPREAIRILRRFYEEWPGGLDEFEIDRRLFPAATGAKREDH